MKILGKRVLVRKERIDAGGMRLTPALEEDGQKNKGVIIGVGQVGLLNRLRGVKVGAKVSFHKHFTANHEGEEPLCFVEIGEVLSIE